MRRTGEESGWGWREEGGVSQWSGAIWRIERTPCENKHPRGRKTLHGTKHERQITLWEQAFPTRGMGTRGTSMQCWGAVVCAQ